MSILQEILKWSQELPAWQSDVIARLFAKEALSDEDMDDIFALLKSEHGIPDPKERIAKRLSAEQIPVVTAPGIHIKLVAIKNLKHVNRIAADQRLPFNPNGLTLIYGDNGSGKSGYTRVLKHVCRARDQSEAIYPDAFLPPDQIGNAEAAFEIMVNDKPDEIDWTNRKPAPEILSSLSVFDLRCARSYLDEEGDFAYVPYGLDILESLAGICKKLKLLIEKESNSSNPDKTPFSDITGNTAVGKLIAGLSHTTKLEKVEELATLQPDEEAKYSELERSLKEGNPKEKANQLKQCASRILRIIQNITQKVAVVDDASVTKLCGLIDANQTAQTARNLAAVAFTENKSFLPGTGGDAWKELFIAARKFSIEAYPGTELKDLGPDDKCPLCQQPLSDGADRLQHFDAFIQEEVETVAENCKTALDTEYNTFSAQNMSLGIDEELFTELESLNNTLAKETRAYGTALYERHAAIMTAVISREWDKVCALPPNPSGQLNSLAEKLKQEAEILEQMIDEKARAVLQDQFNELDARKRLFKVKESVVTAIKRLDHQAKLARCISAVRTNAISLKASEITEKVISKELEGALNNEFKTLGVGHLQVCLKSRSDTGKAYHKLKLDLPQTRTPCDILSEGEQRAVAIGSFLAEVNIGGGPGGIIFDDPVSSLDHKHRERVARRLVKEAAKRQVIIFTHDIYFLNLLIEEAKQDAISVLKQSVIRRPEGFGVADPDLPFEGMNTKARIGYLRSEQQKIKKFFQSGDEVEHRKLTANAYSLLRMAWERAIEELLFSGVVLRFRKGIETQRLAGVIVDDDDYAIVDKWMTKCSNYSHDQALLGGTEVPDPDELLVDINFLDDWREDVLKRTKKVSEHRKSYKTNKG